MRLLELENRETMAFGVKEIVGTLVSGGILMMIGLYAFSKVGGAVDLLNGGTYVNTTHYCPVGGTWNGTACNGATLTTLPADYAAEQAVMDNVRSNVTSGFDMTSIIFIMIAVAGIIGVIWLAFR